MTTKQKDRPLDLEGLIRKAGFDSRAAFARALGVRRESTWRWETGRQQMTAQMCKKVADVLGVDMETVLKAVGE